MSVQEETRHLGQGPGSPKATDDDQDAQKLIQLNTVITADAQRRSDLKRFLDAVYGTAVAGRAHWAVGIGGHLDASGKYVFEKFSPQHFAYPGDETAPAVEVMLSAADTGDVYVCPYLMWADKRTPGAAVARPVLHDDWDGDLADMAECLERVTQLDGFALQSGSPGHLQIYVPLAESIPATRHRELCEALHRYLPPGSDPGKKTAENLLRPPGTWNHKGRARGGESALTTWMIRPTGARVDVDTVAELLGLAAPTEEPSPGPQSPREVTNASTSTHPVDLDARPLLKAELEKNTGDRSVDTARIVGACYDARITLPQTRWVVDQRPDLARRIAEFFARTPPVDDVAKLWLDVVDNRQAQRREQAEWDDIVANSTSKNGQTVGSAIFGNGPTRAVTLVSADAIEDDVPDWVWTVDGVGRIQRSVLTLLAGRPGTGKSTAARWFAAQWTRGLLEGLWYGKPKNVAYIASEESLRFVVKPGLRAAGADMSRIFFPEVTFDGRAQPLIAEADERRLTELFRAQDISVIVVDPIMATIDRKVDIYRNNELRAALAPWVRIAEAVSGTVAGIVHLRKGTNSDVVGAVNGSSAFGEVARCVFGFVKDPDSDDMRVMSQVKNSCGPEDLSRSYQITGRVITTDSGRQGVMPVFVMGEDSDVTVEEILGSGDAGRNRGGMSPKMRRLVDLVNSRDETHAEILVAAGLAKNTKRASEALARAHQRGYIDNPTHGSYTPKGAPPKAAQG
jgi:AAA domain